MAWEGILYGLLVFLPAYVANMSPVFTAKVIPRWSSPIDGGRTHKDGRRLLGDGKTWRGLTGGALTAGLTALIVALLVPPFNATGFFAGWDYGLGGYPGGAIGSDPTVCPPSDSCPVVDVETSSWWAVLLFGSVVGFFALAGDAVESYFKRRRGKGRGDAWFPFDQLDFVLFGLVGFFVASPLLPDGWVRAALLTDWVVPATIIFGTVLLHLAVNRIGYWLKLKEVPW